MRRHRRLAKGIPQRGARYFSKWCSVASLHSVSRACARCERSDESRLFISALGVRFHPEVPHNMRCVRVAFARNFINSYDNRALPRIFHQ